MAILVFCVSNLIPFMLFATHVNRALGPKNYHPSKAQLQVLGSISRAGQNHHISYKKFESNLPHGFLNRFGNIF